MSDVRFRLIGINQDNRADGSGKAGLTFQAIGYYNIKSAMNTVGSNAGGWRDSQLRKNLNDKSNGTIWNAIQSTDLKNNITPVLKTTNTNNNDECNHSHTCSNTSNASLITTDKLFILSPSEMVMPVIKNYKTIYGWDENQSDANVHYYDSNTYKNTIKSSNDGNSYGWFTERNYIYAGDTYQWWMLPAGSRKMSNGNQAYHNTDIYSYCALDTSSNPSANRCYYDYSNYWLRYTSSPGFFAAFDDKYFLEEAYASITDNGIIVSFSF